MMGLDKRNSESICVQKSTKALDPAVQKLDSVIHIQRSNIRINQFQEIIIVLYDLLSLFKGLRVREINYISHWLAIYPADNVFHLLNNSGLEETFREFFRKYKKLQTIGRELPDKREQERS